MKRVLAAAAFAVVAFTLLNALTSMSVLPGISEVYNLFGSNVAPNRVTAVLFDFRGYDTLGEAIILVSGVLAVSMLYGRGLLTGDSHETEDANLHGTLILKTFTPVLTLLIVAAGVYVTLGGHITPGGGFQGGAVVAAGFLLTLLVFGRAGLNMPHSLLVKMESAGALLYITLGLIGLAFTGYFLYNVGVDAYNIAPAAEAFNYPDGVGAGIIPYLNIAVLIKVSAGLTTAMLVMLGARR